MNRGKLLTNRFAVCIQSGRGRVNGWIPLHAPWQGRKLYTSPLTRVAKSVNAGQVFMNCYGAGGGVELPFGGTKRSGHGREKGLLALEEVCTTKTLVHYHG